MSGLLKFYKKYMIWEYEDYYAVYHPEPNSISFPLCRVGSKEEAEEHIDREIEKISRETKGESK